MQRAGKLLLEYNDFQSFSKVHTDVDHFLCDMFKAEWLEKKELLIFKIEANRFLGEWYVPWWGPCLTSDRGRLR